jgi:hypothetical protein
VHAAVLQTLNIAPMAAQLDSVRAMADQLGHWNAIR